MSKSTVFPALGGLADEGEGGDDEGGGFGDRCEAVIGYAAGPASRAKKKSRTTMAARLFENCFHPILCG
jgi:hypothetical protein